MAWQSINNGWDSLSSPGPFRVKVKSNYSVDTLRRIRYTVNNNYEFKSGRTYQYVTTLWSYITIVSPNAASFSVSTPWNDTLEYGPHKGTTSSLLTVATNSNYYFYSSPTEYTSSEVLVTYTANPNFGLTNNTNFKQGITNFKFSEMQFFIQGYAFYKWTVSPYKPKLLAFPNDPINSLGWTYDADYGTSELFHWYDHSQVSLYPVGGEANNKRASSGYRQNNYIAKFIPYSHFNLKFSYQNEGNFPLEIWLTSSLPSKNPGSFSMPSGSTLIATFGDIMSGTYSSTEYLVENSFYSLPGLKFLLFKGPYVGTSTSATFSNLFISDIKIEGGYHPGNNQQYLTSNNGIFSEPTTITPTGLTGATYSAFIGAGNTINATFSLQLSQIFSNIGNGKFKAGIWENGVWNSGWRYDEQVYEFERVFQYFNYNYNKRWRIQIQGRKESVNKFNIGDKVAIGNIVSIDINESRKVLRNYFTIIAITSDSIIVEFDSEFPLRRIEQDSLNHRIYITKNVWLSGAFLNGYFTGVWNYGLFKGYPLITEMVNSHWIDGTFDGGHFKTSYYQVPKFVDTLFYSETFGGKVGLTFSSEHGLAVGDTITIDKDDKSINPTYDGETIVERVINDFHIVTNLDWSSDSLLESGTVSVTLSKGLVQRINFKAKNMSQITSVQSLESLSVFQYNSWMDVNYDNQSAVNIGKPMTLINETSQREYSENNLFGYPTYDVLESVSYFRDSYSRVIRPYNLGYKYKIFSDYIGESGEFKKKFVGDFLFSYYGWTYSRSATGSFTFSRTESDGSDEIAGEELEVLAYGKGGILDIFPVTSDGLQKTGDIISGRTNEEIERNRYTFIEFDLITYSNVSIAYLDSGIPSLDPSTKRSLFPKESSKGLIGIPDIHFNNLNFINRNIFYGGSVGTASTIIPASYLPISSNIYHVATKKKRKVEYFFNKRNLSMHFLGQNNYLLPQTARYVIDNLHFYQTDMIPFFQYFRETNINKGIEVPYYGVAPFIDYSDNSFNFIDNVTLGEDSISIINAFIPQGGIGTGIVTTAPTGTIYTPTGGDTNPLLSGE